MRKLIDKIKGEVDQHDFCAFLNKDLNKQFTWEVQPAGSTVRSPVDLTTVSAASMALRTPDITSTPALTLTIGSGITIDTPASGIFSIAIEEDFFTTADVFYYWDIQLVFGADDYRLFPMVGVITVFALSTAS